MLKHHMDCDTTGGGGGAGGGGGEKMSEKDGAAVLLLLQTDLFQTCAELKQCVLSTGNIWNAGFRAGTLGTPD